MPNRNTVLEKSARLFALCYFLMYNVENGSQLIFLVVKIKVNCSRFHSTFNPMYVFPVPGGPWITANSLVSAICRALNWESSRPRSSADGQEARSKTGTLDTSWNIKWDCKQFILIKTKISLISLNLAKICAILIRAYSISSQVLGNPMTLCNKNHAIIISSRLDGRKQVICLSLIEYY